MVGEVRDELGIIAEGIVIFEGFAPRFRYPGPIIDGEPVQGGAPKRAFISTLPLGIASWVLATNGEAFRLLSLGVAELDRIADRQVSFRTIGGATRPR